MYFLLVTRISEIRTQSEQKSVTISCNRIVFLTCSLTPSGYLRIHPAIDDSLIAYSSVFKLQSAPGRLSVAHFDAFDALCAIRAVVRAACFNSTVTVSSAAIVVYAGSSAIAPAILFTVFFIEFFIVVR